MKNALCAIAIVAAGCATILNGAPPPASGSKLGELSGVWSGWTTVTEAGTCSAGAEAGRPAKPHKTPRRVSLMFAEDGSLTGQFFTANSGEPTGDTLAGRIDTDSRVTFTFVARSTCGDSMLSITYAGQLVRTSKPATLDLKSDFVLCEGSGCTYHADMKLKRE